MRNSRALTESNFNINSIILNIALLLYDYNVLHIALTLYLTGKTRGIAGLAGSNFTINSIILNVVLYCVIITFLHHTNSSSNSKLDEGPISLGQCDHQIYQKLVKRKT